MSLTRWGGRVLLAVALAATVTLADTVAERNNPALLSELQLVADAFSAALVSGRAAAVQAELASNAWGAMAGGPAIHGGAAVASALLARFPVVGSAVVECFEADFVHTTAPCT
jgi:hypothetical protein